MLRRDAVLLLVKSVRYLAASQIFRGDLIGPPSSGTAVLLEVPTRKWLAVQEARLAANQLVPPGSTVKPMVLRLLLKTGRLSASERFYCPGRLEIGGRTFDCTHPRVTTSLGISEALAYSCNCFVAQAAMRLRAGELAGELQRAGFASLTGLPGAAEVPGQIASVSGTTDLQLQALGEDPLRITAAELAVGYRALASSLAAPEMRPVLEGLEKAVTYGTAQKASVRGLAVAGKTGTVRTSYGARFAWFAGFAPSRAPQVVVTVLLQGHSGGADAAPVGGRILGLWQAGKLG